MKRFVWNAAQSGRILRRHRMLALFLILQCALCLGMAGTVANQAVQSGRKIEDFQTRVGLSAGSGESDIIPYRKA